MATKLIVMRAGESIFIDFNQKSGAALEATMTGTYDLLDSADASVASGALGKSGDLLTFELRIAGADTAGLSDGTFTLLVKVVDSVEGYADIVYEEQIRVRS